MALYLVPSCKPDHADDAYNTTLWLFIQLRLSWWGEGGLERVTEYIEIKASWSLSRQLTGTTTVDCYFHHSFLPTLSHHFSVTTFSHRKVPRIKKVIQQKLMGAPKTLGRRPLSRPHRPFWGPLEAILDFAGGERMAPAPLGWY